MLEKVNIIGDKYVHVFRSINNPNQILEVETTQEDYEQLATPQHKDPVPPDGFRWDGSIVRKKYDTPSGDLEDGQYAEYTLIQAKVEGKAEVAVEPDQLTPTLQLDSTVVLKDETEVVLSSTDIPADPSVKAPTITP
jgi:hypothetical protein